MPQVSGTRGGAVLWAIGGGGGAGPPPRPRPLRRNGHGAPPIAFGGHVVRGLRGAVGQGTRGCASAPRTASHRPGPEGHDRSDARGRHRPRAGRRRCCRVSPGRGPRGLWAEAMALVCLPLAAPTGLSPWHSLTLWRSERVLVGARGAMHRQGPAPSGITLARQRGGGGGHGGGGAWGDGGSQEGRMRTPQRGAHQRAYQKAPLEGGGFILRSNGPWDHRHICTEADVSDRPLRQLDWLDPV